MLTILQNVISDCCHLLLFLLVAIVFLPATIWAFKKVKKIQACNKKQSKYRVPWIASLEKVSVTSIDPGRTEQKSCNNLSLYQTLCVLDKKIEYLTWQMQRISKPISRSASNTTVNSITSLYSWAQSSTRDVCYSRSRTPPSPVPIVSQGIPVWQGHVTIPYKTVFQKSRQRSSSYPPTDFHQHQKPKQRRRSTPTSESLTKLTPRVPSTVRSSPVHIQRPGGRIHFLDYKEQELLDWHVHKKHWQKEAPPLHWEKEAPPLYWEKEAPPLRWQKEAPTFYWQKEEPLLQWQKEAPPLYCQKEEPLLQWQKEAPPLYWQKEASPLQWQKEAPSLYWQKEAPPFSQVPRRETNVQVGITPRNEMVQWVSQQVSADQRSRSHTPPSTGPKRRQTPHKPPPVRSRSPGPRTQTPVPSSKDMLPTPFIICHTTSPSNLKAPANVQIGITPQNELVHWVGQERSRTPPSTGPKRHHTPHRHPPVRAKSPGPRAQTPVPSSKDLVPTPFIICQTTSHSNLKAPTNVQIGITPQNELVQWVGQERSSDQRSCTPPSTGPKHRQTPHKHRSVRARSPGPRSQTPAPSSKDLLPAPFIICQTTSHSNVKTPTNVQIGITPQNELVHWVGQEHCSDQRSRTPPSTSPKGRHTPPKPPPVRARSPGPRSQTPPSKDVLPPPLIICQTTSHSSLKAPADGNLSSMTAQEELTEILNLLAQNKSLLAKQPARPRTPKKKEKDKKPSTSKESAGRSGSPKGKPAETPISLMLDRKAHRLSWADDMEEIPKESEEFIFAQTSFLDPTFMCQNQLELPCVHRAQVELHQESFEIRKRPPESQCLAHAIVESLDTEQATRDLHMCLAKGLENGRSQPSVEYPICLLCGRCTPYCPHPHPQHGPCLLVYPRLNVQDGEVYMNLGFLLKMKRQEANRWGLVQGKEASKLQHSKEHPSKQERRQSRSRSRNRYAHEAVPPSWAPERRSHPEAIDLRARRYRAGPRPPRSTTPRSSPRSPKMESQARIRKPASEAHQPKPPEKSPNILKRFLISIRKVWAKVSRKKEPPATKQSSRASLRRETSSQTLVDPSAAYGVQAKGRLHHKQDSLPKGAVTTTHSKQGYPHGHRKVSTKVSEHETFHPHKKVDSYRAKSASSGAPKKYSRRSPPMQFRRSPSRDNLYY
ncbi:serine/arginine repetitive matrix protein 2-like [Erythrolamprus reginae]|uniref:serine/arginine repetitive matrix protein 2-like n=1 Tax=Erythrolamprus reginae TaxID=121349 RepID=UPI00396CE7C3